MYARAKCVKGRWNGELLIDHLRKVAEIARGLSRVLEFKCPDVSVEEDAYLAGLLHDVGKALYQYMACKHGEKLAFPGHEIAGALIAASATRHQLIRPILLHHQGLRGIRMPDYVIQIFVEKFNRNLHLLEKLIGELDELTKYDVRPDEAMKELRRLKLDIRTVRNMLNWHGRICNDKRREYERFLTATVMMADVYVTERWSEEHKWGREESIYTRDVVKFVERCLNERTAGK